MLRSLALTLFVLATLPMAFAEPFVGFLLWVLFSYMNPHRLAYGFAFNFHWVFLISSITLFSMMVHAKSLQKIRWNTLSVLLLIFLIWTGITTLTAVMSSLAVPKWIQFLKIQVMVFATLMLVTDRKRMDILVWVIVASFGLWAAKGGLFTALKGGHYHVLGPSSSFFGDNNQFALVMCMALPFMRYLQLIYQSRWIRWGLWVLMGLTVLSIVGTYSRGGLLGLFAVLFMLFMKSRNRFGLLVIIAIAVPLTFNFLPQKWANRMESMTHYKSDNSAEGRIDSWKFATNVALAKPVTAGGFSVWASNNMWNEYGPPGAVHRAIHSVFFQVLGEQGFVGLMLFVSILAAGWRELGAARRLAKRSPEGGWINDLAGHMQVSLAGYVVAGAFLPQAYFDFTYQIIALAIVLKAMAMKLPEVKASARFEGGI